KYFEHPILLGFLVLYLVNLHALGTPFLALITYLYNPFPTLLMTIFWLNLFLTIKRTLSSINRDDIHRVTTLINSTLSSLIAYIWLKHKLCNKQTYIRLKLFINSFIIFIVILVFSLHYLF